MGSHREGVGSHREGVGSHREGMGSHRKGWRWVGSHRKAWVTQERDGDGRGHTGKVWRSAGSHWEGAGSHRGGCPRQWQCVPDQDCHLRGSKPLAGLIPVIPGHVHKAVEREGTGLVISEP